MTARRARARYERTRTLARRQMRASLVTQPDPQRMAAAITDALATAADNDREEYIRTLAQGIKGPGKVPGTDPHEDEAGEAGRTDGLPAEHPESMDLELAPADEVWLAMISDELWPCDEYQQIVAEDYRHRPDGAA
jgi:hypothetical protein